MTPARVGRRNRSDKFVSIGGRHRQSKRQESAAWLQKGIYGKSSKDANGFLMVDTLKLVLVCLVLTG